MFEIGKFSKKVILLRNCRSVGNNFNRKPDSDLNILLILIKENKKCRKLHNESIETLFS